MAAKKQEQEDTLFDIQTEKAKESATIKEKALDQRIVLRAVYGKTQGPIKIRPALDMSLGRVYTGQELMSEDEKRKVPLVIDQHTTYTLSDGIAFNKNDATQMTHWEWIKKHPYVAKDWEEAQQKNTAFFYVEDIEADLDKKATKRDKIFEALKLIKESSRDKKIDVARLLGNDVSSWNPKQVSDLLEDMAMERPDKIIEVYADQNYKVRLFIYKLIDKKVIKIESGVYKYNDIAMGLSEAQCIEWLKSAENIKFVELLKQSL